MSEKELMEMMVEESTLPNNVELSTISNLAQQQLHLMQLITQKEEETTALKAELKQVQEVDLPTEMAAIGLSEVRLTTGEKVDIKTGYAGSITKAKQPSAYAWMNDNGYGSLIKTDFTVKFGKGESDKAKELQRLLEEHGVKYSNKEGVHHSTLKSFIKEIMAAQSEGELEVPEETFSIYRWNKAEIKL